MLRVMEATADERQAFGSALGDALNAKGIDKKDFAVELTKELDEPVQPASISQWTAGTHEPSRKRVFAIERLLGYKPGVLSRHLGYLPANAREVRSVLDAIDADPKLNEGAKGILRAAYQGALRG